MVKDLSRDEYKTMKEIIDSKCSAFKKIQNINDQFQTEMHIIHPVIKLTILKLHKINKIEEDIENEMYYEHVAIPIKNVDDLFGRRFERKLKKFKKKLT